VGCLLEPEEPVESHVFKKKLQVRGYRPFSFQPEGKAEGDMFLFLKEQDGLAKSGIAPKVRIISLHVYKHQDHNTFFLVRHVQGPFHGLLKQSQHE
jgi:hypothetical protein